MRLLLASASPRRADILRQLGYAFEVRPVDVDESRRADESAGDYLNRVAADKALAARAHLRADTAVLVADTIVTRAGRVLGKPAHRAEHYEIIVSLQGNCHEVWTQFTLFSPTRQHTQRVSTSVHLAPMSDEEIRAYVDSGDGTDKAGGYGIQGAFAKYVEGIQGSYTNVVGLPAREVALALDAMLSA